MPENGQTLDLSITVGDATFQASGPADLVMQALAEFDKLAASSRHRGAGADPTSKGTGGRRAGGPSGGEAPTGDKVPFGVFMKRKFPNQHAMAAAIFTWAKRYDDRKTLKPGEMETYWKKVAKKPGNTTQVCLNAEKQGWLENVGGGQYAVTGHGEKMVDKLPERADDD